MIASAARSSTTDQGEEEDAQPGRAGRRDQRQRRPSASAVSVDIATPQPRAAGAAGVEEQVDADRAGDRRRSAASAGIPDPVVRSRSSPRSISRLASSPTTRKKSVISPSLTQLAQVGVDPVRADAGSRGASPRVRRSCRSRRSPRPAPRSPRRPGRRRRRSRCRGSPAPGSPGCAPRRSGRRRRSGSGWGGAKTRRYRGGGWRGGGWRRDGACVEGWGVPLRSPDWRDPLRPLRVSSRASGAKREEGHPTPPHESCSQGSPPASSRRPEARKGRGAAVSHGAAKGRRAPWPQRSRGSFVRV